jgi:hypothetical protein
LRSASAQTVPRLQATVSRAEKGIGKLGLKANTHTLPSRWRPSAASSSRSACTHPHLHCTERMRPVSRRVRMAATASSPTAPIRSTRTGAPLARLIASSKGRSPPTRCPTTARSHITHNRGVTCRRPTSVVAALERALGFAACCCAFLRDFFAALSAQDLRASFATTLSQHLCGLLPVASGNFTVIRDAHGRNQVRAQSSRPKLLGSGSWVHRRPTIRSCASW